MIKKAEYITLPFLSARNRFFWSTLEIIFRSSMEYPFEAWKGKITKRRKIPLGVNLEHFSLLHKSFYKQ